MTFKYKKVVISQKKELKQNRRFASVQKPSRTIFVEKRCAKTRNRVENTENDRRHDADVWLNGTQPPSSYKAGRGANPISRGPNHFSNSLLYIHSAVSRFSSSTESRGRWRPSAGRGWSRVSFSHQATRHWHDAFIKCCFLGLSIIIRSIRIEFF